MDHVDVDEIRQLVIRAAAEDGDPADRLTAYGELVGRFQDITEFGGHNTYLLTGWAGRNRWTQWLIPWHGDWM